MALLSLDGVKAMPPLAPADDPICYAELQVFAVLPSNPAFVNLTRIQQPLLSPADAPAFIVLPTSEEQLRAALACASSQGLRVSVKSGGHSFAGYSRVAAPGFMISLQSMTSVSLDQVRRTARVTGAARWGDVYEAFSHSGNRYQVVGGLCPSVGVIGYTSGGGVGPLARDYGLAADNVLSYRLTLANGSATLVVDETNHPDLYWALRGSGGGQFGVVSEMTFRMHEGVDWYTWGQLTYSNRTLDALALMAKHAAQLPRWLNVDAALSGGDSITLWIFAAQSRSETLRALAPFLDGGSEAGGSNNGVTVSLDVKNCFWEAIQAFADAKGYSSFSANPFLLRSYLLPNVSAQVATVIAQQAAETLPSDACGQSLIQFGGRISEISPSSTAFPWRQTAYMLYMSCGYNAAQPNARAAMQAVVDKWTAAVEPHAQGSYVNFVDSLATLPNWPQQYWGANLPRLLHVKQQYNPPGVGPLRFPQEIGAQPSRRPPHAIPTVATE
jgi:hypothetical protein